LPDDFSFEDEDRLDSSFFGPAEEGERPPRDHDVLDEKEVKVVGVFEHREDGNPQPATFVLLRDATERSVLIFIGRFEAQLIFLALEGTSADRPLTHDLLNNVIDRMGGKVERLVIDDLWNSTYYAKISISTNGKTIDVDTRPSDGIAVALRAKAPIFMAEAVLEKAAVREE
jgi:bifunctional DNase/RNase